MKHELKNYSSAQINKEWRIKVKGVINGIKYNTLVGVSGLLKILGGCLDNCRSLSIEHLNALTINARARFTEGRQ